MPDNDQNNAWVQVMLDTLDWERNPVGPEPVFLTEMLGQGRTYPERGTVFTIVRQQEKDTIHQCLADKEHPLILDFGCGIARHSDFIHEECPTAAIWGVESESRLLAVCQEKHGDQFVADLAQVGVAGFDLALLLGNNACIFGNEAGTRAGFARLRDLLRPGGFLLGEFHPFAGGVPAQLRISYPGRPNPPVTFQWLFMSESWVTRLLAELGLPVIQVKDSGHGAARIFIAQKPQ